MKPKKRTSVNPRRCVELIRAKRIIEPWRSDVLSDDAELAYWAVTDGMAPQDAEELADLAAAVADANTVEDLEALAADLKGTRLGKKLHALLQRIGPDVRQRIRDGGVDIADVVRAALVLVYGVSEHEREDIVKAAVRYGRQIAFDRHRRIIAAIRKDPAALHALGAGGESLRKTAKRMGTSLAALSERVARFRARIRAKIHR